MSSSVIRLAVNACRMMSIVAILRSLEDPSLVKPDAHISSDNLKDRIIPRWNLVITDDDFHAVLALVEPLYLHATHVLFVSVLLRYQAPEHGGQGYALCRDGGRVYPPDAAGKSARQEDT